MDGRRAGHPGARLRPAKSPAQEAGRLAGERQAVVRLQLLGSPALRDEVSLQLGILGPLRGIWRGLDCLSAEASSVLVLRKIRAAVAHERGRSSLLTNRPHICPV